MTLKRYLFALIHGYNGQGKSDQAHRTPGPHLSLDYEGRSNMIRDKVCISWDEYTEKPGQLTEDHVVFYDIDDLDEYRAAVDFAKTGEHEFNSLVLDSLLVHQEMRKEVLSKTGDVHNGNYDFWGALKTELLRDMKELQKLTLPTAVRPMHVTVVCPTNRDDALPKRPDIEGGARRRLVGLFDLVAASVKVKEEGEYRFRLEIDLDDYETDEFEVKCDIAEVTQKLRDEELDLHVIWDANLTEDVVQPMNPRRRRASKKENV